MKKSKLKTGMVVETNNGRLFLVLLDAEEQKKSLIDFTGGFMDLRDYTDDLKFPTDDEWNVKKVYSIGNCIASLLTENTGIMWRAKILWERKEEQTEMTVAEIEKKLGIRNLKIVKEK